MKIYISYLRIYATLCVILLHTVAPYVSRYPKVDLPTWLLANGIDSLMRACVPLFVMITGALLLGRNESIQDIIQKRFKRVLSPLLIWSIIYIGWKSYIGQISWPNALTESLQQGWQLLAKGASYHFWYLYMIMGLYLLLPLLQRWMLQATQKELAYFLLIWVITLFINPYTQAYFPSIELIYFSKYIGYLVLGYYLDQHVRIQRHTHLLGWICLVLGVLSTACLTLYFSSKEHQFVSIFYNNATPNVALAAVGYFLIAKSKLNAYKSIWLGIDCYSFGIYFIHVILLYYVHRYYPFHSAQQNLSAYILYVSYTFGSTLLLSFGSIYLFNKIPIIRKFIQ